MGGEPDRVSWMRRTSAAVLALAAIVPAVGAAADSRAGIMLNTREFIIGAVDTSHHHYRLAVWKGGEPDQADMVRVVVRRVDRDTGETVVENASLAGDALRYGYEAGYSTIRFNATLPVTGAFDIVMGGWGGGMRATAGFDPGTALVAEFALETLDGLSNQIAGGSGTGFLSAIWGLRAHGVVAWSAAA